MPRLTKIYTRTGDDGTTGLGSGSRVAKSDLRIEAYGTVDELNALLGVVLASELDPEVAKMLREVQNDLFHAGSDLCFPEAEKASLALPGIEARHVDRLEGHIDRWNKELPALENFILPGGSQAAARIHVARTVCRRAERAVIRLREREPIGDYVMAYLNRLSDALFVIARLQNHRNGVSEPTWDSHA